MKSKLKAILEYLSKVPCTVTIPIIIINTIFLVFLFKVDQPKPTEITYTAFMEMVDEHKIEEIKMDFSAANFKFEDTEGNLYETSNPKSQGFKLLLLKKGVKVIEAKSMQANVATLVMTLAQAAIMGGVILYVYKSTNKQATKFSLEPEYPSTTLDDIAGNEEAKTDLKNKIKCLANPEMYKKVGAIPSKGILLTGPPGTGKTLMAKALAGESQLPFFSMSGSDFVELYVGVGARRIRDLFKAANEHAPCIVFIDELDAVGGARNGQGNDSEREQTLNALLVEMNKADGVIVIAATNRVDMLDAALIRPGRFDDKIVMAPPSKEDRKRIILKHLENKKIADDVEVEMLAKKTLGWPGADIASLINGAAQLCAYDQREIISKEDIDTAYTKILTKGYRTSAKQEEQERLITAWHEAGHALCIKLLTNQEVSEVSIIPTTSGAGGYTMSLPDKENLFTKKDILDQIQVMYAGRAAEHLVTKREDMVTTGASNDIQRATQLIQELIGKYGMGDNGLINLGMFTNGEEMLLEEAITLSKKLYTETYTLLSNHVDMLQDIADLLLEKEVINDIELSNITQK